MPDHVFRHENRKVLFAIVNAQGKTDHFGTNLAAARPRIYYSGGSRFCIHDFLQEFDIHEGSFFE
jgi:hypothetical protein